MTTGWITLAYAVAAVVLWAVAVFAARRDHFAAAWVLLGAGWLAFLVGYPLAMSRL